MPPRWNYMPIRRPARGYTVATGPGSALMMNRVRYLAAIGTKRALYRARRNIRWRRTAVKNNLTYGFAMRRKYR